MFFSGFGPVGMASKSLEFLPHSMPVMTSVAANAGTATTAAVTMLRNSDCPLIEILLCGRSKPAGLSVQNSGSAQPLRDRSKYDPKCGKLMNLIYYGS